MMSCFTRRAFLGVASWALAEAAIMPRGEIVQYVDPVTENRVLRLTSPTSASVLPYASNRFATNKFLIFSSDRSGRFCPYRLDLRSGALHQLAETEKLDPKSLCVDESERSLLFIDAGVLKESSMGAKRERTVAENVTSFSMGSRVADLVYVRAGSLIGREGRTIASDVDQCCAMAPDNSSVLFTRRPSTSPDDVELWYAPVSGSGEPKRLVQGLISNPFWSASAQEVFFLRTVPHGDSSRSEVHQVDLNSAVETLISDMSQFAAFAPNRDSSVFVGASRSKAQPSVVLLLRSLKRELTLCEHRARDASSVSPVFSPDSKRVVFASDREGKMAIYSVPVELLVEPT